MIYFSLVNRLNFYDFVSHTPDRRYSMLENIFHGEVFLSYFKGLSQELGEILEGKRSVLSFDEGHCPAIHTLPTSDPCSSIVFDANIAFVEIENLYDDSVFTIGTRDFKQLVDDWIKFVEINTEAFKKKK